MKDYKKYIKNYIISQPLIVVKYIKDGVEIVVVKVHWRRALKNIVRGKIDHIEI